MEDCCCKIYFILLKVKLSVRQVRLVVLHGKQILSFKTIRTVEYNPYIIPSIILPTNLRIFTILRITKSTVNTIIR